jgi:hypothetical protein
MRFRISATITYNNFPMPDLTDAQTQAIEDAMDGILLSRQYFLSNSLAELYDSATMPQQLRQAHDKLDKELSKVFEVKANASDETILTRLFELYNDLTAGLFPSPTPTKRKKAA